MTTLKKITVYRGHMSSLGSQLDVVASTDDIDSVNDIVDKAIDEEVKLIQESNPSFKSCYLKISFHRNKQNIVIDYGSHTRFVYVCFKDIIDYDKYINKRHEQILNKTIG